MLAYFLQGLALGFPAAATPGPLQAFFLSQTMKIGWQKTLPSAFAPLLSDGPIIILVILVLTRVPEGLLRILKLGGGLFILYLAFGALISLRRGYDSKMIDQDSSQKSLFKATLTNLLNPNPYLFWSFVAGPILLAAWRQSAIHGASFMMGFYGTFIGSLIAFILLFATAGRLAPGLIRLLSGLAVVALVAFGLFQLWSGITGA